MVYSGYLLLLVNLCNKAQSAETTIRLDPVNSHHQDNLLLIRIGTDWANSPRICEGTNRTDRLAGKGTIARALLLGRSEVLRSLRHYLRAQSQVLGHHTIDRLEERGVERGSAWRSSSKGRERGPSSVRRTLELFLRQRWGTFWETGWSAYVLFRAQRYHLELKWNAILFCNGMSIIG